ncbi:F-box/FBD/LRR-repeat protein At1g13570-like [Chenopodium quinoa]|uniref:F-box/FBD/LRR-repeat protein At1g13570-like n=1 Tax=Chenopodium quinoa TaxID=63459 RepID=UPI000B793C01|nr:F-box/FBD/LRR-repeat protein At1g13570-like [Chenopodium quinoa]
MSAVWLPRKCVKTTTDRISNLPQNVTQQILECLPLEEAARMSILSSHWRQKWCSISQLILDKRFFSSIRKPKPRTADISLAYSKTVNDILLSHVGPIRKFVLYVPAWFPKETDLCQWIRYVRAHGVQDFTLVDDRGPEKNLPTSLFSCVGLAHLTIGGCKLLSLPPTFKGFPSLISLKMRFSFYFASTRVAVKVLETLISKCPQLQSLYLFIIEPRINLTIHALNMKDLCLKGLVSELYLKGAKVLTSLTLDIHICEQNRQMNEIFTCLTNVEKLALSNSFWKSIERYEFPTQFPRELERLQILKLEEIPLYYQPAISLALCLLVSSPHLEQLYIKASKQREVSDQPLIQIENSCILPCLKNVQLFGICGLRGELQLIKYLLAFSPSLEEMTIELSKKMGGAVEKFSFAMETTRYRRASADVEVIIITEKVRL